MKTVTNAFVTAQARPDSFPVKRVQYKRRYWQQSSAAYIWETNWTTLDTDRLGKISPITANLDTDQLNEFKVSNLTIVVNNFDNHFRPDNPSGFFKQDSVSPTFPYEPYWTKFRVQAGYKLSNGTSEYITCFTGLLVDYIMDSSSKSAQLTVVGLENILEATKAESIATTITQENAGTGNGSNKDFTTLNPGVGEVTLVSLNGLTQIEGSDYTVSQTNDATQGAKVSFTIAPDVGKIVRATYYYWPQGLQFNAIVEALLVAAGIASYTVSPVVFSGSVLGTQSYTTQADWDTGTKTIIDSSATPGSIKMDFRNEIQATTWSQSLTGWTDGSGGVTHWATDGTYLISSHVDNLTQDRWLYRAHTSVVGAWQFKYTISANMTSPAWAWIMSDRSTGITTANRYGIQLACNAGVESVSLYKQIGAANTNLISFTVEAVSTHVEHQVKLVRYANGTFELWVDGVNQGTASDTTITTGSYFVLLRAQPISSGVSVKFREIYIPNDPLTAAWESPVIDMGATPIAFDSIVKDDSTTSGAISYQTKTSTDGLSFDAYVNVDGSNVPQSALKRYAKLKVLFSLAQGLTDLPQVDDVSFRWVTSTTGITLPNFTGLSVYEAIQAIGEFTNYEFGFDSGENFFFRPKSSGDSILSIDESNYAGKISGMDSGYSRVYGTVRATYGSRTREVTVPADFPESPQARVKNKRYEISPSSDITISPTLDIATGVANQLLTFLSKPRRRFKLSTKMLIQLDLSDVVEVSLSNNTPPKKWLLGGGNSVNLGDQDVWLYGDKDQIAYQMPAKVIGARYDLENNNCEFDLEEVLT